MALLVKKARKSPATLEWMLLNTIKTSKGCMEWQGTRNDEGYGVVRHLSKGVAAHRLVCEFVHGSPDPGLVSMHSCDNPSCINPNHIRWGTPIENRVDRVEKKRTGDQSRKLNSTQVLEIFYSPLSVRKLAKMYGCSFPMVNMIKNKLRWKHLTENL